LDGDGKKPNSQEKLLFRAQDGRKREIKRALRYISRRIAQGVWREWNAVRRQSKLRGGKQENSSNIYSPQAKWGWEGRGAGHRPHPTTNVDENTLMEIRFPRRNSQRGTRRITKKIQSRERVVTGGHGQKRGERGNREGEAAPSSRQDPRTGKPGCARNDEKGRERRNVWIVDSP